VQLTGKLKTLMVTPMEPQASHLIGQVEQPTQSVRRLLMAGAIIGVSGVFAVCTEMLRTHSLPDINVWLLGVMLASWFAIHLVQTPWQTHCDELDGPSVSLADACPSDLVALTH
jgi:hypothetical protein